MDAEDKATTPDLSDPVALAALQRGVENAVREYLAGLKTEPLSIAAWADEFGIGRETAAQMIPRVAGAEKFGSKWRLPISKAPPQYWAKRGLLPRS